MDLRRILAATDHTQLSPTATAADIARLCAEAARHRTASVCVAPARVREAKKELAALVLLTTAKVSRQTLDSDTDRAMIDDFLREETEAAR